MVLLSHINPTCSLMVSKAGFADLNIMGIAGYFSDPCSLKMLYKPSQPPGTIFGLGNLSGSIVDEHDGPIPGVSIVLEGTELGAVCGIAVGPTIRTAKVNVSPDLTV